VQRSVLPPRQPGSVYDGRTDAIDVMHMLLPEDPQVWRALAEGCNAGNGIQATSTCPGAPMAAAGRVEARAMRRRATAMIAVRGDAGGACATTPTPSGPP
jgi:hypothetical protein